MTAKPTDKDALQTELKGLLATAHGDIRNAAEKIAQALDQLIQDNNEHNKELYIAAVKAAIILPASEHFKMADPEVRKALMEILGHAGTVLDAGIKAYNKKNELIKKSQKNLHEKIEQAKTRQFRK